MIQRFFDAFGAWRLKHLLLLCVVALLLLIVVGIFKDADPLGLVVASIGLWVPIIVMGVYLSCEWWGTRQ